MVEGCRSCVNRSKSRWSESELELVVDLCVGDVDGLNFESSAWTLRVWLELWEFGFFGDFVRSTIIDVAATWEVDVKRQLRENSRARKNEKRVKWWNGEMVRWWNLIFMGEWQNRLVAVTGGLGTWNCSMARRSEKERKRERRKREETRFQQVATFFHNFHFQISLPISVFHFHFSLSVLSLTSTPLLSLIASAS